MAQRKKREVQTGGKRAGLYAALLVLGMVAAVFAVRQLRTGERFEEPGRFFRGAADAAVVVEEFGDFG